MAVIARVSALLLLVMAAAARAETYQWVQFAPAGLEARAITDQPACPSAQVDGIAATMSVRAAPNLDFPVTVCALPIPKDARTLSIAERPMPLPAATINRIVVLGDTGCRMKDQYVQACNDPTQWPFRLIADVVAQAKPDLVIHVGDYHYRETPCPAGNLGCAGSPYGDVWAVWRADFFDPADTLLKTTPFVFVRGNHEECGRGGRGWSRTLEPSAYDAAKGCNDVAAPFAVRLPDLTLAVMDVASAQENAVDDAQAQLYRGQYQAVADMGAGPVWLLAHRPIWSPGGTVAGKLVGDNKTLAAAANGRAPGNVTLMLSGHHHLFQVLGYVEDLPVQVISGHGGDYLNPLAASDPAGWVVNGMTVKSGINVAGVFGFSLLERRDDGWQLTNFTRLGIATNSCFITGRAATCDAASTK